MHRTQFAGLTAPDPDDAALQVDNGSFATRNPDLTDHFLSIGCVTHRHDGHAALADPLIAASASVQPSGGVIPSDTSLYFGWTATDADGGETRLSPVVAVATNAPAAQPEQEITASFTSASGVMPVGEYAYGITIMDAGGGETGIGPLATVSRPPGYASGGVDLAGLATELGPGDQWRLYRQDNGGDLNLIAVGTADTFFDYGIDPVDHAAAPPLDSTLTNATSMVNVTLPMASGASANAVLDETNAVSINLYMSTDGAFLSPCLKAVYPVASAGVVVPVTDVTVMDGEPPEVSTSKPGANPIDPDTELLDWHWKRPVANAGALPTGSAAEVGDVRVVLDSGVAMLYGSGNAWAPLDRDTSGGGGGGASGAATTFDAMLPMSVLDPNGAMTFGVLAQYGLVANDASGKPTLAIVPQVLDLPLSSAATMTQDPDGGAWHPASWGGNPGGAQGEIVYEPTPGVARVSSAGVNQDILLWSVAAYQNVWGEIDWQVNDNTWTRIGVYAHAGGDEIIGYMDRAAGQLVLGRVTARSPLAVTPLATLGVADGWTPPVAGDSGYMVLRRIDQYFTLTDVRSGGASHIVAEWYDADFPTTGASLNAGPAIRVSASGSVDIQWTAAYEQPVEHAVVTYGFTWDVGTNTRRPNQIGKTTDHP